MPRGQHLGPDLPSLLYKAVNILYKLVHINEFEILFVLIFFIISFLLSKLLVSVLVDYYLVSFKSNNLHN
jgi:hypothetical protein